MLSLSKHGGRTHQNGLTRSAVRPSPADRVVAAGIAGALGQQALELGDAPAQRLGGGLDLVQREALHDVLRAVAVPGLDGAVNRTACSGFAS